MNVLSFMGKAGKQLGWFLLLMAVSCSHQDFRRGALTLPFGGDGRQTNGVSDLAIAERDALFARVASEMAQLAGDPGDYVLGPGDEITVSIFALEAPDATTPVKRSITREGTINLPWVGNIATESCTVRDLEKRIREAYAGRYIKNPQISVEVSQFRSRSVIITGAVRNPGVYAMTENRSTLIEMLAKAGGLLADAADEILIVRAASPQSADASAAPTASEAASAAASETATPIPPPEATPATPPADPTTLTVSFKSLIGQSDLRQNTRIEPGDVITVRSEQQSFFYVLGYVMRPGMYNIRSNQKIDPMRAVALAGGLTPTARAENSYVIRTTATGQQVLPVNMIRMAHDRKEPLQLQAGDTLVVGSSFFSRLAEIVRPSVGMGMNYSPLP